MTRLGEAERAAMVLLAILRDEERATNDVDVQQLVIDTRKLMAGIDVTRQKVRNAEAKSED